MQHKSQYGSLQAESVPSQSARIDRTRANLRRFLDRILVSDIDLMSFCIDYYPLIAQHFAHNMDRLTKTNLLLERVQPDHLLASLMEFDAEKNTTNSSTLEHRFKTISLMGQVTIPKNSTRRISYRLLFGFMVISIVGLICLISQDV